jgi:nucleotide-binding universal stress UspA family protein
MSTTEPQNPILIAYAATEGGREPVEFGLAASNITGAPAMILNIRHGGPAVDRMTGTPDDSMGGDDDAIKHLRLDLQRRGLTADVQVREARTTGGGLVAAMEELKPRMVVLGATSRSSLGAALLGTTIERVIHEAACPVAVVGPDYRRPAGGVQLIGAAYSPTEEGMDALHAAAALARAGGVRLRAITVLDPKHAAESSPGLMAEQHRDDSPDAEASEQHRLRHESEARDVLGRVAGDLDPDVDVLFNDPAEGLIAATRHIDLLIMGSRARGPRRAVVLGSVSRKVAERSACPVVIIPRGTGEAAEELVSHVGARGTS